MLRPGADVGEGQRHEKVGDRPLLVGDAKAFFDHPFQVDPPPANHAVNLRIGTGFDDRRQLAHLLVRQAPGAARAGTVLQTRRPFLIEAVRPVSQRLAIHAADLRGFCAAHAVVDRRQGQKPANLARVATAPGQGPKLNTVVVVAKSKACRHGESPSPPFNHIHPKKGIPCESEFCAVGITPCPIFQDHLS